MSRKEGAWPIGVVVSCELATRAMCVRLSPCCGASSLNAPYATTQAEHFIQRFHCIKHNGTLWHAGCNHSGRPPTAKRFSQETCHDDRSIDGHPEHHPGSDRTALRNAEIREDARPVAGDEERERLAGRDRW